MITENRFKKTMWAASKLAMNIHDDGKLSPNYQNTIPYKGYFQGDVFSTASQIHTGLHAGLVGKADGDNSIIFAFSGTSFRADDWLNNFLASQVLFNPITNSMVHAGFFYATLTLAKKLIVEAHKLSNNKKHKFYFTGHSKGGALATLMAPLFVSDFDDKLIENVEVVTFGSPRVGDENFRKHYNIKVTRYENNLDIVPHLPFSKQEKMLFQGINPILEKFSHLRDFPPYYSIGEQLCAENSKRTPYVGIPCDTRNEEGEILNSFCAACQLLIDSNLKALADVHQQDYEIDLKEET